MFMQKSWDGAVQCMEVMLIELVYSLFARSHAPRGNAGHDALRQQSRRKA